MKRRFSSPAGQSDAPGPSAAGRSTLFSSSSSGNRVSSDVPNASPVLEAGTVGSAQAALIVEARPTRILGIGIDLAEPSRVARAIRNRRFLTRVYAAEEIEAFAGPEPDLDGLARAFALKEALLKAVGTGWTGGVDFHEVVGPPLAASGTLVLRGRAAEMAGRMGVTAIHASSCRMNDVAMATVILLG